MPERLQAVILLGGSVRASTFGQAIQRPVLDLPVEGGGRTLMALWQHEAAGLARALGAPRLQMRVMLDREAPPPAAAVAHEHVVVSVERDPHEFRGAGGVLRDLSAAYADEDYLLVANAAQVLTEDLADLAREMASAGGDVTVVAHEDGTPSGLMLVRCAALRSIPATGFIDMKEQALPGISKKHAVEVVTRRRPTGMPIRHLNEYVKALRCHHLRLAGRSDDPNPYREEWAATFAVVEDGATAAGARVHDSVVLRGAHVEPGAVLVRTVVCPGMVVGRGTVAVEQIMTGGTRGRASA